MACAEHELTMLRTPCLIAISLVLLTVTPRAEDKPLLIELPITALPLAIGAGGAVVVGNDRTPSGFYWMPTTRDIFIGGKAATGISRDGRTIVGTAVDARGIEQAAIWVRAAEWRLLGSIVPNAAPCDSLLSSANGTNENGTVIVGLAWNGCRIARAFRWEESTGMVDLGSLVAGRSTRADAVSGDGQVVVGWQETSTGPRQGARWVNGRQELLTGPAGIVGEANGTNSDGSIIVGQTCRSLNPGNLNDQSAWMWTTREGVLCMPMPRQRLPGFIGLMLATSNDGRVIGGGHSFGLESEAVIWINRAPAYLKDYLRANGTPDAFEGWVNTGFITAVSHDGRVIVGYGAGPRNFQGYMVILGSDPPAVTEGVTRAASSAAVSSASTGARR